MLTGCAGWGAACPQPLCLGARGLSVFATVVCMDLRRIGLNRAATMLVAGALGFGLSFGLAGCDGSDGIVTQTPTPADSPSGGASVTSSPSASDSVAASPGASPGSSATASSDANAAPLSDEELLKILPESADRTDLQGAVVTAEFFIQEFPRMMSSGDTDVWDSLSLPDCKFCESSRANALKVQRAEWVLQGGAITQGLGITEANLGENGDVYVKYPTVQAEVFVTKPDKEAYSAGDSQQVKHYLEMRLAGDVWRVVEVDVVND